MTPSRMGPDSRRWIRRVRNALYVLLPVVILTSSEAEKDIAQAYEYHANSYLVKPVGFDQFTEMMEQLGFYWLGWNHYPWAVDVT